MTGRRTASGGLAVIASVTTVVAGFLSFLLSVWLYFVQDQEMAGIFVGLWVPSIHSLGTLLLAPVEAAERLERVKVRS